MNKKILKIGFHSAVSKDAREYYINLLWFHDFQEYRLYKIQDNVHFKLLLGNYIYIVYVFGVSLHMGWYLKLPVYKPHKCKVPRLQIIATTPLLNYHQGFW